MIPICHIIVLLFFAQMNSMCMQNIAKLFSGFYLSHQLDNNKISRKDTALESLRVINKNDFSLLLKISPMPQEKEERQQPNQGSIVRQLLATVHIPRGLKPIELSKGQSTEKVDTSPLATQVKETSLVASECKKRLIVGSAALTSLLFIAILCQKSNLKHFIINMIDAMKQERLRNYLRAALERSIDKSLLRGFIDANDLERMLIRFNDNDPVVTSVLNQEKIYSVFDTEVVYDGSLLGAIFFKALVNFDQAALEIFLKHGVIDKINMTLYRNDQKGQYYSLPLYVTDRWLDYFGKIIKMNAIKKFKSFKEFESNYEFCVDFLKKNNIFQGMGERELCEQCMIISAEEIIKHSFGIIRSLKMQLENSIEIGSFLDLESLEFLLCDLNDHDSILAKALQNRHEKYRINAFRSPIIHETSLLGMLFVRAAITIDLAALELFLKYEIHKKIEINFDNDVLEEHMLLFGIGNETNSSCLQLVLYNIILQNDIDLTEIQKKWFVRYIGSVLRALIKGSFLAKNNSIIINENCKFNLVLLEQILSLFNEKHPAIVEILNQENILRMYGTEHESYDFFKGTILGTLFVQAVLTLNQEALQLFFKYDVHKKIEMNSFKNKDGDSYSSLPICIMNLKFMNSERQDYFLNLIMQNGMIQQDYQIEEFIKYVMERKYWLALQYVKMVLQYIPDLKNLNPYYRGANVVAFINSRSINNDMLIRLVGHVFVRSNDFYKDNDVKKCIAMIPTMLYQYMKSIQISSDTAREWIVNYIHLLLSYGAKIEEDDILHINSVSEKMENLEEIFNEEIDLREKFLQFDRQKNQSELFNAILRRSAEPVVWMKRIINQKIHEDNKKMISIHSLAPYCLMHLNELLSLNSPCKQYNGYLESWIGFTKLFFEKDNPLDLIMLQGEKSKIREENKKLLDTCIVKIVEYNYFRQISDHENTIACEPFLFYCLGKENPEIPFPDISMQGRFGNVFHIAARSGICNNTITKIMEIAKTKNQELSVLGALTQVFKQHGFNDEHTPFDLAEKEIYFAHQEQRDSSVHEKTIAIMNNFLLTCFTKLSSRDKSPLISTHTLVTYCIKQFHELLSSDLSRKQQRDRLELWADFIKLFFEKDNYFDFDEKNKIRKNNKKLLSACTPKIIEYNYFNQTSDHENTTAVKKFLFYCLGKDNPEINLPDLCKQGKLGNLFHIMARSGCYNTTMTEILQIAKEKKQEFSVLRALTQSFKQERFNDEHTPFDLVREEVYNDSAIHKETLVIMNEFIDHCREIVSTHKKSPHIAYSPWEDQVNEMTHKAKKSLSLDFLC